MSALRRLLAIAAVAVVAFIGFAATRASGGDKPSPPNGPPRPGAAALPALKERWRLPVHAEVVGLPAVDASGVVVTAGESQVLAVDPTGQVVWTTALDGAL